MARNIEIKARVESIDLIRPKVAAIADGDPSEIVQDDTFFSCANGRLKLRTFSDSNGQLIFYNRPNVLGPKESFYLIAPTAFPVDLSEVLSLTYGQCGRVQKRRTLYMIGRTRVHLDRVEGLGEFIELEVVLGDSEASEEGVAVAHELLHRLGITAQQLVEGAYVDLLTNA
jgi:predicted adenylyl cyclase CyaB